jgi:hypothetical protein
MKSAFRHIAAHAESALIELTARWPGLGLRVCDLVSALRRVSGLAIPPTAVDRFFPLTSNGTWKEVVRQRMRARIARGVSARKGVSPYRFVPSPALSSLRGPAIMVTFHVGAMDALGTALSQMRTPAMAFKRGKSLSTAPNITIGVIRKDDLLIRAAAIRDAVRALRRQEVVMMAVDGGLDGALEVECLGHQLRLGRGAFALARITGAPVIPFVGRWRGTRVETILGDPLPRQTASENVEQDLANEAARWLERYLSDSPGEIGPALERFRPLPANN